MATQTSSGQTNSFVNLLSKGLYYLLLGVILVLSLTGGTRDLSFGRASQAIEFSQVDVFAWAAFFLFVLDWKFKIFGKNAISPGLEIAKKLASNPGIYLTLLTFVYVLLCTVVQALRFESFHANAYDLGFVDQAIWSSSTGNFLKCTICKGGSYLGEHFSPVLALLSPFYLFNPSVYWLFFFNSVLIASGAMLLFFIAKHLNQKLETICLLVLLYFLYQPLRSANLFDFREDVFYIPVLFGAILFLLKDKMLPFFAFLGASFFIKENAPLVGLLFSVYFANQKDWKKAAALAVISLLVFGFLNAHLIPMFAGSTTKTVMASRLSLLGTNAKEIFYNLVFHPINSFIVIGKILVTKKSLKYLYLVLFPFIPFIFFKPQFKPIFFLAVGSFFILVNLVITQQTIGFHYELILVPFLFTFAALNFKKLENKFGQSKTYTLCLFLFLCVFGRSPVIALQDYRELPEHVCIKEELQRVPKNASIATQTGLQPFLTHRSHAAILKSAKKVKEDFVVVSFAPGVSTYATPIESYDWKTLDQNYREILHKPYLSIWCKNGINCELKGYSEDRKCAL